MYHTKEQQQGGNTTCKADDMGELDGRKVPAATILSMVSLAAASLGPNKRLGLALMRLGLVIW